MQLFTFSARARLTFPFRSPWWVSTLVNRLSDHLTARLTAFFLGSLAYPSVPCDDRGSEIFGGTASLCLG